MWNKEQCKIKTKSWKERKISCFNGGSAINAVCQTRPCRFLSQEGSQTAAELVVGGDGEFEIGAGRRVGV